MIRLAACAALLVFATACGESPAERVILISIDTLRADRVGAYGDERARTPILDGLAQKGVRFEQAISPAPVTLPSHTSLLTGLNPPSHGVRDNSLFSLSPEIPTLAENMLADNGDYLFGLVLARRAAAASAEGEVEAEYVRRLQEAVGSGELDRLPEYEAHRQMIEKEAGVAREKGESARAEDGPS